jgi:hypothetical protein
MPQGRDDSWDNVAQPVDTHTLLLSLAGLLDDELLGWCRELVAVGEADYAVELVSAAVQADRLRLPPAAHEQLHAAASRRGLLGRGETLPALDTAPKMRHRFLADPVSGGFPAPGGPRSPEHALGAVPARLLRDCTLWLSWRCTPAGGAPGPLPHPVVLIEADEADGAEVLAYQVGEVLLRAGLFASVEVFARGPELGDYHRAALAEAHRVDLGADRPTSETTGGTRAVSRPAPTGPGGGGPGPGGGARADVAAPQDARRRPEGPPRPGPLATAEDGRPTPLRPVDRVIAARNAGPRRPRPEHVDRADTGFDEIASGLTFDRPPASTSSSAEDGRPGVGGHDGSTASQQPDAGAEPPAERRPGAPGVGPTPERRP